MKKSLNEILSHYNGDKSDLIPILQDIQSNWGYLPEDSILNVSKFIGVPESETESEIYGVTTFYTQFRFKPRKKHITSCKGTACHVEGATHILKGIERYLGIK